MQQCVQKADGNVKSAGPDQAAPLDSLRWTHSGRSDIAVQKLRTFQGC